MRKAKPASRVSFDMETVPEETSEASTISNGVKYTKVETGGRDDGHTKMATGHISFPCALNVVCIIMGIAMVAAAVIFLCMVYAEHYAPMGNATNFGV